MNRTRCPALNISGLQSRANGLCVGKLVLRPSNLEHVIRLDLQSVHTHAIVETPSGRNVNELPGRAGPPGYRREWPPPGPAP